MSASRTAKLFGIARGCKGGATIYEKSPSDYNAKVKGQFNGFLLKHIKSFSYNNEINIFRLLLKFTQFYVG